MRTAMIVQVYWNRTQRQWSLRTADTRRVVEYRFSLFLLEATFHVSEAGRQRVIRTNTRTVHAWIEGTLGTRDEELLLHNLQGNRASYRPFEAGYFRRNETDTPVHTAPVVWFDPMGQVWF